MISAWKLRARDGGWTTAEILKSRSGKYTNNLLARSACGIQIRKDGHPLKGLNYIVFQLDPDCMLSEYVEADLDPARLLQVHEFGDWYLVLGPGCCIRVSHLNNCENGIMLMVISESMPSLLEYKSRIYSWNSGLLFTCFTVWGYCGRGRVVYTW